MTCRRAIVIYAVVSVLAAAAATIVAVVSASPMVGAALFAVLSLLVATVVFRKWPVAGLPWYPWSGVPVLRKADDDVDPALSGLWRVINIGWFVVTGIVVISAIRDIVGS